MYPQHIWLAEKLEIFYKVFVDRVKNLNPDDCPLTTVLGDQGVGSRGWNFPRADEHPDSEEELEKNKNEESEKE